MIRGHLARRVELSLALARLLRKLHHEILIGIANDVIAAGTIVFEVNCRILEYGNQARHLIDQFLAGAKFIGIVEADIRKGTLESVVLKELLDNLIHPFADIALSLGGNQILKGSPLLMVNSAKGCPLYLSDTYLKNSSTST